MINGVLLIISMQFYFLLLLLCLNMGNIEQTELLASMFVVALVITK